MNEDLIKQVQERKLAIYAEIRFNEGIYKELDSLLKRIAPKGDTRFLSKKHRFFSYCNQRDVWYGEERNSYLPYKPLKEFI